MVARNGDCRRFVVLVVPARDYYRHLVDGEFDGLVVLGVLGSRAVEVRPYYVGYEVFGIVESFFKRKFKGVNTRVFRKVLIAELLKSAVIFADSRGVCLVFDVYGEVLLPVYV